MSEKPAEPNSQGQSPNGEPQTPTTDQTDPKSQAEPTGTPSTDEGDGGTLLGGSADGGEVELTPLDPDALDLSPLGDEVELTDEDRAFMGELSDLGVSQEAMQRILEEFGGHISAVRDSVNEQITAAWEETQQPWIDSLTEKYGGMEKVREAANRLAPLIDQYGGQELREALDLTGMGNHPAFFAFLEKVQSSVGEATPVDSGSPGEAQARSSLYPKMHAQKGKK